MTPLTVEAMFVSYIWELFCLSPISSLGGHGPFVALTVSPEKAVVEAKRKEETHADGHARAQHEAADRGR